MNGWQKRMATVEQLTVAPDAATGAPTETWTPLAYAAGSPSVAARFPVEIQDILPGRAEGMNAGLNMARRPTRVRMRWRNDVTTDMRITIHGDTDRVCQFVAGPAEVVGRRQQIELIAENYSS